MKNLSEQKADQEILRLCGEVAAKALPKLKQFEAVGIDHLDLVMSLYYCNTKTPLDLARLLTFDDFSLLHDVCGIHGALNRKNYELNNCFLPRCAR